MKPKYECFQNYNGMSYYTYWNPNFYVQVSFAQSMEFEAVLTAYGYHTQNVLPKSGSSSNTYDESQITTIHNPNKN